MKNIVIWSREIDLKIAQVVAGIAVLSLAGIIILPLLSLLPDDPSRVQTACALVAVPLGVLVWAVFELFKPSSFTPNWRRWLIAELGVVPILWLVAIIVFAVWWQHLIANDSQALPHDPIFQVMSD